MNQKLKKAKKKIRKIKKKAFKKIERGWKQDSIPVNQCAVGSYLKYLYQDIYNKKNIAEEFWTDICWSEKYNED